MGTGGGQEPVDTKLIFRRVVPDSEAQHPVTLAVMMLVKCVSVVQ